jgi:hypothetical protein
MFHFLSSAISFSHICKCIDFSTLVAFSLESSDFGLLSKEEREISRFRAVLYHWLSNLRIGETQLKGRY